MSPSFIVKPAAGPLQGSVPVPADWAIVQRALLLAALSASESEIHVGAAPGGEVRVMVDALSALGVAITAASPGVLRVKGVGLAGLKAPSAPIQVGRSVSTAALLAGVLSPQLFSSVIEGSDAPFPWHLASLVAPLRRRGGAIEGRFLSDSPGEVSLPLQLGPVQAGLPLLEAEEGLASPDPLAKGALLLSGLYAQGDTYLREPVVSADHTERMLAALGAPVRPVATMVELLASQWDRVLSGFSLTPVGDHSAAMVLAVAALNVPGSRVTVRHVGNNPTRSGLAVMARAFGAGLELEERGERMGEPLAELHVASGKDPVRAGSLDGEILVQAIDDVAIAAALMARSHGVGEIRLGLVRQGPAFLRGMWRLTLMEQALAAFGLRAGLQRDALIIEGKPEGALRAAEIDCGGDGAVAMACAVLALSADGPSRIRAVEGVGASFPRFAGTLRALGADVQVVADD